MNHPAVSVVIPTYDSADLVVQAIDSVLAQTVPPAEIIVVDDGSRDDTCERLASYGNRILLVVQENQGVAAARNHGVKLATGKFIAFLDADDIWHPRKLELQLQQLTERPQIGLLGTRTFDWPAATVPAVLTGIRASVVEVPWQQLVVKNYFTTSSVIVRRSILGQVGEFDTTLQGPEDYDLWLRIAESSQAANLDLALTGYRSVAGSLSKQASAMETHLCRILRKLDERAVWAGRRLLRRKAHSYCGYSCAYLHGAAGSPGVALARLLGSFAWYPFPYRRAEVRMPLARLKLLGTLAVRMLRLTQGNAWFEKGSGTFVRSTLRALGAKVPDPFSNHAQGNIRP